MAHKQHVKRSWARAEEQDGDDAFSSSGSIAESSKENSSGLVTVRAARKKRYPPAATALATTAQRNPKMIWRTRDQENSMLYNYQLDVAALQSEMQTLQQYRNMLMQRAMNRQDDADGMFVKLVREYFNVFKNGYTAPRATRLQLTSTAASLMDTVSPVDEFVRRVVDDRVKIGRFVGLAQMMKQWERYSSMLGPLTVSFLDSHVVSIDKDAGDHQVLVTSRASYHLYISLSAIESMFPHLLPRKDIVTKILGRRITGVGKFDFVFDTNTHRIVQYEFSLDLMSSFIDLLGDPGAAAVLLRDALISDEFFIGDLSDFQPLNNEAKPVAVLREDTKASTTSNHSPIAIETDPRHPWKMKISSILADPAP